MSISALSSNSLYTPVTSSQSSGSTIQQDFKQLAQALQSNDLSGAQSAFSSLQQLLQSSQSSSGQQQTASTTSSSPLQTDFNNLGNALASGDLSGAQSAFTQLQSDLSAATQSGTSQAGGHHHHRHHEASSTSDTASTGETDSSTAGTQSAVTSPTTAASGTNPNGTISLLG
jgi:ribosomal protein S20